MSLNRSIVVGAAIMSAIASTANATQFIYSDTNGQAFVGLGGFPGQSPIPEDSAQRPDLLNTFASGPSEFAGDTTISTTQTSDTMRLEGFRSFGNSSPGAGYGFISQAFTVDAPGQVLLTWDATGSDGIGTMFLRENGSTLFRVDEFEDNALGGSVLIDVTPGAQYQFTANFLDVVAGEFGRIFNTTDVSHFQITLIPTPGAAAVFGLASLAATRRRR